MKIKPEHYEVLKTKMQKTLDDNLGIKERYKRKGLSKERFAWDICYATQSDLTSFICGILYKYLDDSHIQTALFKIIGEY